MSRFIAVFRFIIFKNIFIGFCAFFLFQTSRLINDLPFSLTPASIFVFCSTVLYYNFHDISAKLNFTSRQSFMSSVLALEFSRTEKAIFFSLLLLSLTLIFFLSLKVLVLFGVITVLSSLYSVPVIPWKGKGIRIREIMFFKLGIIAFCWAIMAVQIPLNEASITLSAGIMTIEFLSVALFIFALCIPFEIRDIQLEFSRGIKTIPVVYGIRVAKTSGFLALLISMFLQIYKFSQDLFSAYTLIALMISLFITMLIVLLSAEKPSDMYCKFYVDGIMILQFILVFLSLSL